ncbi:MAG: RAMP superfamily CRISPR-associated protein [Nostoc sp.]|uniref:RAMP superfamily CRISPR-associated protein n=1 Tax=Nostoc sp. TaxID=1180 RepID=UPI002FF6F94E
MYKKAYGIIETLAPLHVGASAGEETGNLNLIFRDQFTQTGIIPGSSIRGRFRADMREYNPQKVDFWYGREAGDRDEKKQPISTTEALVKFEYASVVWLPVYCPNQPVVMVSCPLLLKRYHRITGGKDGFNIQPYMHSGVNAQKLFFNLGFINLGEKADSQLTYYKKCAGTFAQKYGFVVVNDADMSLIHDMSLYRQSRVKLKEDEKIVDDKAFFNVEALPEKTILVFPLALRRHYEEQDPNDEKKKIKKDVKWDDYTQDSGWPIAKTNPTSHNHDINAKEFYFGGLESIGFGRTEVNLHNSTEA